MLKLKAYLKSLSLIFAMTSLFSAASAWSSEILSAKDRAIIPVAAFTASGESEKLKISLNEALDAGLTINELKEVLVQLYAYAGFPRSLNGLATFMTVLDARKSQGIQDVFGRESSPLPTDKSSLELGTENQTKLIGVEVKGALFDFSPQVDEYLKAHLFGDIFERDVLSWKQRELATIAALANIHGVNRQLAAHFNISMNNHISPAELKAFILVLKTYCGEAISVNARQVLDQVLASKQ
ncbi:carboxymuconolactone decarboxylase family protein [Vibrio fluvialis]|nr:carboxymuconolactone decarboxylase family protein [Vibrio fluvialis]